jgi:nucleoside 2-deoxyribosyltransferase
MKIYLASRFADRLRLRKIADQIWSLGHEITTTWLSEVAKKPEMTRQEFWRHLARKDLQEIAAADLIIRDVHRISHTGGADVEFGFALGRHQHCMLWLICPKGPRNVFHTLADKIFPSWDACLKELKKYE